MKYHMLLKYKLSSITQVHYAQLHMYPPQDAKFECIKFLRNVCNLHALHEITYIKVRIRPMAYTYQCHNTIAELLVLLFITTIVTLVVNF